MSQGFIVGLLAAGGVLLVASLLLRVASGGRYEIKPTDLVWLVVPLLVVGVATGKVRGLDMFGVKADLSSLFAQAADAKIAPQLGKAPPATVQDAVQTVEMAAKGGVQDIGRLIARKVEALEFRLGQGGYYGPAIRAYFEALSGTSQLRVVVISAPDGSLYGVYTAAELIGALRVGGEQGYAQFEQMLNAGAGAELARLPGFIKAEDALAVTATKREALARMEALGVDLLPVRDAQGRFAGTVGRAKLTASLILAVTQKLEAAP